MNHLLFGHNKEQHIVAVQMLDESKVRVHKRTDEGVTYHDEEFFPFFYLSDKRFIEGYPRSFWLKKLSGNNFYQYVCAFPRLQDLWDALRFVLERVNETQEKHVSSYTETEHLFFRPDTNSQYLMQSGKTLFKGMEFHELYRLQLDIETYSKNYKFSIADRIEDRIILIALSDNRGWETVLGTKSMPEKALLERCVEVIREKDPDVIEGHNILSFDIPYILRRCEHHSLLFAVGRDGSPPHGFFTRTAFAENEFEYMSYEVPGRHILDTLILVQSYDVSKRNMESYGLKYAARYFGIADAQRTYIPGEKISWYWDNEPETLRKYALDDVRETRALSDRLSMSSFYLTQMLPFNYGTVARMGSAAKIEALMLREYLRQRYSIPKSESGFQTTGGYTDIFYTGVLGPIVHADVESLYPSIMISKNIYPRSDELKIFNAALQHLTQLRLQTKRKAAEEKDAAERSRLDAMQASFKILINSFYGYLGYSKGLFNDYARADEVTSTGQELLKQLIREIDLHNGAVVEVDTDGIFFVPPDNVVGVEAEEKFVEELSTHLPQGIRLGFNGSYKKMLSYKKKNYALLSYDDRVTIKGSSLVSRSMERFGRDYIKECIDCILQNRIQDLHNLYLEVEHSIREHSMDVKDFSRTETLKDPLQEYLNDVQQNKRNRTASYELAIKSLRKFKVGSRISFYYTGNDANIKGFENAKEASEWDPNFPDENVPYYLKRLEEYSKKFEAFFWERDFKAVFSSEDLFGFDPSSITVRTEKILSEEEPRSTEPQIWLDA